jgi:alpha-1,3-rhamnosyl/mannosyltransferase
MYLLDTRPATTHFPGIGRYVRNLARCLPTLLDADEKLAFLEDAACPQTWLHNEQRVIASHASPFSLAQQWQIPRLMRQAGISLYHSPYYLMPYRAGAPTLLTIHDIIALRYPQLVSRQARWLFRLTHALALHAARRIIAVSEATRQDFIAAFHTPAEKIVVIPHAVEARFQPQSPTEVARLRGKFGLQAPFALYVGINKPHKNLERLVRAWRQVRPAGWQLIIAGAWDARYPQVRQAAAGEASIRFLGPMAEADLPGLYSAAALFAFPSLYEGFGLPVLEAMACGTPVICSHASSLPEVGGEAVGYFDPLDEQSIGEALLQMTGDADLRGDLAQRGLARARSFAWERCAQQTLEVYRHMTAA